ncbi:hypothetical protein LOZ66_004400 [Ophidiomyces ophidiicola]|nr:hypothetical protein LOZ66_004400 [Ophidiomyces ophidiicola]
MSSDDAYSSFLESANADPSAAVKSTSTVQSFHTTQSVGENQQVPQVLKNVEMYYVSDADEEFEPASLHWDKAVEGKWPTPDEFQSLILLGKNKPSVEISTLPETSFDPRKQYGAVYDAIRTAITGSEAKGTSEPELKVYRVQHSDTRMEYWVMGLDKKEHRLLGMKARAIES